ncbi:MAG TPA: hypothetical protein VFN19_08620 [Candidatus Nanopelagicales bacterium]|jgi:hypothetical protein|nr:hypothetical protein [Candidatus Nanopelagicales bacterium]
MTTAPGAVPITDHVEVIRPAAVLPTRAAHQVLAHLRWDDVANRGVWNASASVWQRYSEPWNGLGGTRGDSVLLGSIAVMYDTPARHEVTIYRVTITPAGQDAGWTVARLCDDALTAADLTLADCPVTALSGAPMIDPFRLGYDRA